MNNLFAYFDDEKYEERCDKRHTETNVECELERHTAPTCHHFDLK